MHDDKDITTIGYILALNTCIPCLLAAICFYKAGTPYECFKVEIKVEKEGVEYKLRQLELNMRTLSVASLNLYETTRFLRKPNRAPSSSMFSKVKRPLLT